MNRNLPLTILAAIIPAAALTQLPGSACGADFGGATGAAAAITSPIQGLSNRIPSASELILIKNRAAVFGSELTGSLTRNIYISSADLKGKSPAQLLQTLAPAVSAADPVRRVDLFLDLTQPLVLYAAKDEPVSIGTTTVAASRIKPLEINSSIFLSGVTVIPK